MARSGRVFLSYRRLETRHVAGRLADRLEDRLGSTQVFMDVNAIEPGADIGEAIAAAVASCDVLITLIGPSWTTVTDQHGRRRLEDPDDFVVLEVASALKRGVRVVPVLVDGATMPTRDELPAALQDLARRHGVRVDHDTFRSDVEPLIGAIERLLHMSEHVGTDTANPTPEPQTTPQPRPQAPTTTPRSHAQSTAGQSAPTAASGHLTAADVRDVTFGKPTLGRRGYNEDQVDAFLDIVEATLRRSTPDGLTAADIRNVGFAKPSPGKRGYNEDEVDAFLDLVEAEFRSHDP